jgi:hypothetical protein
MELLIMKFSPITSFLFVPNILLNALFSHILSLCSSLNVRDQVSHTYRTIGKIIVLYILIFYVFRQQTISFWYMSVLCKIYFTHEEYCLLGYNTV